MQKVTVPYDPALDDGGGAPGAEPQRYVPGEIGGAMYTPSSESDNNDFVRNLPYRQSPQLYMPSGNPVTVPLDTQAPENLTSFTSYPYLRSHSSSLTQTNFPDCIHSSNDSFYSQSTAVPTQRNNVPTLSMYHHEAPVFSVGHASGVGSNDYSLRPRPTFTGYDRDHTSISLSQDEYSDVSDNRLLESLQFYPFPAQNDTGDPQARNTRDLAASQGLWSYASPGRFPPGPLVSASSLNAPMPTHLNARENNNWFTQGHPTEPQAIDVRFTVAPPELQAHYTSPPYPRMDHPSLPFTENPFFNLSQLYSPPYYWEGSPPHQRGFGNRAPGDIFDPVSIGTAYQRTHLHGHAEQSPPPISEVSIPPLASLHHGPTIWMPYQQNNLGSPELPITANQHEDSPPQSLSSSSEVFGYTSQVSGKGSSDGASSSSPTTMIQRGARTPATDPPDTPDYGGLNTFLSQCNSLSGVSKRSRQCRPPVLKLDECPPNLRPYFNTGIPIPPLECDAMYEKYGDKTCCIKCGYDVTPPRRPGLKYEHVSAHIDNRPYYCLICHHGFFRKSNHSKTHHPPLWRTTPPSSR